MLANANPQFLSRAPASGASFTMRDLVQRVKWSVDRGDVEGVRRVVVEAIKDHPGFLPNWFLAPKIESYARREIYSDPNGKFSILAMVWAPGQGTPLHDHGGLWVMEAVYQGQITVCQFEHLGEGNGLHHFVACEQRIDGPGISEWKLPPHDFHTLSNKSSAPAVTIHVFGGILRTCNIFEPTSDGYKRMPKTMCLD